MTNFIKLTAPFGISASLAISFSHASVSQRYPLLQSQSSQSESSEKHPLGNRPNFSGNLGLDFMNYTGNVPADRDYFFPSLKADARAENSGQIFDMAAEVNLILSLNASLTYVEIPEAYFGNSSQLLPFQIHGGRKLQSWNKLDELWGYGVFQPRNRWDYLNPSSIGLIGVFGDYHSESFSLSTFASPGFIPERGLPVDHYDGKFSSSNPWFISPSNSMDIFGKETSIRYDVKIPPIKEIVANPGFGAQARLGKNKGPWISGSYLVKPVNQLLVAYDGQLNLATDEAEVTIIPRVVYHQVTGLEAGVNSERVKLWTSGFFEKPIRDKIGSEWTTQEISDSLAVGAFSDTLLVDGIDKTTFQAGYLRQWGGDAPDRGPLATPNINTFESRFPFKNAVIIGITSHSIARTLRGLSLQARWINDFEAKGSIMSPSIHYSLNSKWQAHLGADILTSSGEPNAESTDFINNYRANDRVTGGFSYAF